MMYHCITGKEVQTDYWHETGGFSSMKPFQPLYFYDNEYWQRRHEHVRQLALADDAMIDALLATEVQAPAENSSSLASLNSFSASESSSMSDLRALYKTDDSGIPVGIVVSQQPASFFDTLRNQMDQDDPHERCSRYKGYYNETHPAKRRIFWGSNIATEPWEVFEIVGTEAYGLYSGIVLVESNRTQNFAPRRVQRLNHGPIMAHIFGVPESTVQIRNYVNEDHASRDLIRENQQRFDIMAGWLELGMTRDDFGIVSDIDETFSRDMLLAMQSCHGIPALDYETHHCHHKHVRLTATTQVFEASPECISPRDWTLPAAMLGHCIEGIADPDLHPPAPREPGAHTQARGYGGACWFGIADEMTDNRYPAWG
jgi:Glycosyltransferase family 17